MAYNIKYRFRFVDIYGSTYWVRIRERNYDGEIMDRPLGAAPVIRMQESGAFRATSCDLVLECAVDGEFASLFTSDPRQYQVEVYRGGIIWQGFVATEIYSEPDIAPPYDVRITATDGLGTLKEYDFEPTGLQTVRKHLEDLLIETGMENSIYSVHSIRRHGDSAVNFLDNTLISLDHHAGRSVYDALEDLLKTLRCYITQWRGQWVIVRETDLTVDSSRDISCFTTPITSGSPTYSYRISRGGAYVGQMGAVDTDMWPIGYITKTVRPAKKSVKVKSEWHLKSAAPPTTDSSSDGWYGGGDYSHSSGYPTWDLGSMGGVGQMFSNIPMSNFMDDIKVTVKVAHNHSWTSWNGKPYVAVYAQYMDTGGTKYYHPDTGWTNTSPPTAEEHPVEKTNRHNDPNGWDEYTVTIPSANVVNDVQLTIIVGGHLVTVAGVSVQLVTVKGYEDTIIIDNGARGTAEDLSISGGREVDGYIIRQEWVDGVFVRASYQTIIESFDDADNSDLDYLSLSALNYAKEHAAHRIEYTGTLNFPDNRYENPIALVFNGVVAALESFEWNLKEAEFRFKAVTKPTAVLTVTSETITSLPND